jgi:hypothetical protein
MENKYTITYNQQEALERELVRYKKLKAEGQTVVNIYNEDKTRIMRIISIDEVINNIKLTLRGQ